MLKLIHIFRRARPAFAVFVMSAFMVACSPSYNWRVIPDVELGYSATFPDKPVQVKRTLGLIGLQVPLTLKAAVVQGHYFAVGTIVLDDTLSAKRQELARALVVAAAQNIKASEPTFATMQWLGREVQVARIQGVLPDGKPGYTEIRAFEYKDIVYEVLIAGPGLQPDDSIKTPWFSGFALVGA